MGRHLNLDRDKLDQCYDISARIVANAAKYIDRHSSRGVERATLLLMGVEGEYRGIPCASWMVEKLTKDQLRRGVAFWWGKALAGSKEKPQRLAEDIAGGKLKWESLPEVPISAIKKVTQKEAMDGIHKLTEHRKNIGRTFLIRYGSHPLSSYYFHESRPRKILAQVKEAEKKGADVVSVRFTSKKIMEEKIPLDELRASWEGLKDVHAIASAGGLSLPEQTYFLLKNGHHGILLDGLLPAMEGEMDGKRSLIDFCFALSLVARWPIKILNALPDKGAGTLHWKPEQLIALLLLYEQFGNRKKVSLENIMLAGRPVSGNPTKAWAGALSTAQVLREMFSQSMLWYRLSKHMEPFYFFAAAFTEQDIIEIASGDQSHSFKNGISMLEEALKWRHDFEGFGKEFELNTYGKVARGAHAVLEESVRFLKRLEHLTLWKVLENDTFKLKRSSNAAGGEGVFQKGYHYWNPAAKILEDIK